jgi:hypothetical protein
MCSPNSQDYKFFEVTKTTIWWALEAAVAEDYGCYVHKLTEIYCYCKVVKLCNKLNAVNCVLLDLWLLNSYDAGIVYLLFTAFICICRQHQSIAFN